MGRFAGRLIAAAAGAALARAALSVATSGAVSSRGVDLWRINFRGKTVSLAGGPALAVAASASAAAGAGLAGGGGLAARSRLGAASLVAGLGAGAVGWYDDMVGARPDQPSAKGFAGHLGALRQGHVTSGLVKIVGVGAAGVAAAALLPHRRHSRLGRAAEVALGAGVIAGTANLVNLLDLRPGRALKAGIIAGTPLALGAGAAGSAVAGTVGAAAALLPDDLSEQVMLGDCGANALGALIGVGLSARTGLIGRGAILAALSALTAASEKVSFTAVIEKTPGLRELDGLGRGR